MEETKLSLSPEEWAIVADPEIILTKNAVLHKIKSSLEALHQWQLDFVKEHMHRLPADLFTNAGKISRGENYNGLPYLILDYPRNFGQEHIFAIRSLFWWGKQVSTTLHLSGKWKAQFAPRLMAQPALFRDAALYISDYGNEWEHDVQGNSYRPFNETTLQQQPGLEQSAAFVKIASFAPIVQLEQAPEIWQTAFRKFLELLF
ncbi:hypothetical protein LQ567_19840 [Niabella pedocola]|uniref:Uncharacterized protein n=1 Tax=Niabella pedocola TaxID=1752077 RepID=A0ABS8PVD7_9BACT|nr:hypothetical protein [Niabella pedocola]MCD2425047.1 hypothetical protein [Niabella pedocola]